MMKENNGNLFSLVVVKRILGVLNSTGEIKKTNLAGKTGLNYPNCIRYLELLKLLGWVRASGDGAKYVQLTEQGISFHSILSSIEGTDQNHVAESSALPDYAGPRAVANLKEILMEDKGDLAKSVHCIMLVDDEPDVLLTYKFFLAKQGYNVEAFPDAKSALANIKSVGSSHYDLVITDIRMQSLNGLQLYHRIRSIDPGLKVIFVSALDAIEELVSVLPGVTGRDIIRKPVNEQEFVKTVKDALLRARPAGSRLVSTIRK